MNTKILGYRTMTEFANTNAAGLCALTGVPVYEIKQRYSQGHPFPGRPMKVGAALPECLDVWLLLMNGDQMMITVHKDAPLKDNFTKLWKNVINGFIDERIIQNAAAVVVPKSAAQVQKQEEQFLALINNPPVGILCTERTLDRGERQKAAGI